MYRTLTSKDVNMFTVKKPSSIAGCCAPLTEAAIDEDQADELAGVLKALADPVRLRIVSLVANAPGDELCACDLPAALNRSQPTVSHHLGQLVKAGILVREQRGKWAWFRIAQPQLDALGRIVGSGTLTGPGRESSTDHAR
jgi:ArsR family transcriptional regulator, arsenate/arsenite/antimonite-responsive transcriptional repressor